MTWAWEYDPDDLPKGAPEAFVAQVEAKADEVVRACEAMWPHGAAFEGDNPKGAMLDVPDGFFVYLVVVRHETVYVRQMTCLSAD